MPLSFSTIDGRRYARFTSLADAPGLRHGFSTRDQNLSARVAPVGGDGLRAAVRMAGDLGLDAARLCWCDQVHEPRIAVVKPGDAGGALPRCDAVMTAEAGRPLMTFSADCPLVLVYEPRTRCLGLAHAGWRNTVVQLAGRLVARLREEFGARPEHMRAGIGPSAGPERYEVGEEVYAAAAELPQRERLFPRRAGRMCFDLWEANRAQLVAAGVPAPAVELAGVCTIADADVFYSYRREGPGCGLFALAAALDA